MVTITNGKQQEWVITEKEYYKDKAKWNARGEVKFDVKEPMLTEKKLTVLTQEQLEEKDIEFKAPNKKDAKKKAKQ